MAERIQHEQERALLHLLGLSSKALAAANAPDDDRRQSRLFAAAPSRLLLARALSPRGRRAIRRYWASHCGAGLGGLGPAAASVAARANTNNITTEGMPPEPFERLVLCKLRPWLAPPLSPRCCCCWRAQALRDALDPRGRGLLSCEALGLGVAMVVASVMVAEGSGRQEGDQEDKPLLQRRLRARLWRAVALTGGERKEQQPEEEEEEDEEASDVETIESNVSPASIPLASAWACGLMMGAEERHLAAAWREQQGGDDKDAAAPPPPAPCCLTAPGAEALVAGALRAQSVDPARVALLAPCCGFEWVQEEVMEEQEGERRDVVVDEAAASALGGGVDGVAREEVMATRPCCCCVIS